MQCLCPRRCGTPLSDNSREGNPTQSQKRRGGFWGQALSPQITGDSQLFEILGFQQSENFHKKENSVSHNFSYVSKIVFQEIFFNRLLIIYVTGTVVYE
jgi:hypothetical protein